MAMQQNSKEILRKDFNRMQTETALNENGTFYDRYYTHSHTERLTYMYIHVHCTYMYM